MKTLIILLLAVVPLAVGFKDCNFTQFDFFSHYSLGQQDELNNTFKALNNQMGTLPSIELKTNASVVYRINNAKTAFTYLDGKQKAEAIGDDLIYISGGRAETYLNFSWAKDSIQGTGMAFCLTDPLNFAKLLYLDNGFLSFKLADNNNITFLKTPCEIRRVDPVLQPSQLDFLVQLLNENNGTNVKSLIIAQAMKNYQSNLNASLYSERFPVTNHYEYTWNDTTQKKNITINYTLLPTGSHLRPIGLFFNFVTEITDDDNWKCGPTVPSEPKDVETYGGIQEYLSMSIIQNTIRFAAQKGILNTVLNRQNWESRSFQFFVGDLYDVIPQLAKNYYADSSIDGSCNTSVTDVKATMVSEDVFSVSLPYNCELKIISIPISSFSVDLTLQIQIVPQQDNLVFKVVKATKMAQFRDVGLFQIHDIELANYFLSQSLDRLKEGQTFGSGWKTYSRDYPKVILENGYLFIYDASGRI